MCNSDGTNDEEERAATEMLKYRKEMKRRRRRKKQKGTFLFVCSLLQDDACAKPSEEVTPQLPSGSWQC